MCLGHVLLRSVAWLRPIHVPPGVNFTPGNQCTTESGIDQWVNCRELRVSSCLCLRPLLHERPLRPAPLGTSPRGGEGTDWRAPKLELLRLNHVCSPLCGELSGEAGLRGWCQQVGCTPPTPGPRARRYLSNWIDLLGGRWPGSAEVDDGATGLSKSIPLPRGLSALASYRRDEREISSSGPATCGS